MSEIDLIKIMHDQPTSNIGMIGSVSDGKSTIVKQLTSIDTQRHSSERKSNKTINLGYANAKIYKCPVCPSPTCYQSVPSEIYKLECNICNSPMELKKHVSFVDVPGHNSLMATMLNGTCVMDNTIIVESVTNKEIPAPQTKEHLLAAKFMNLKNEIVCMNKMDLLPQNKATKKLYDFKQYLIDNDTVAKNSFMLPIAANYGINKDVLCACIASLTDPIRDLNKETKMIIVRSFKNNKPDTKIENIMGGVVGGTIIEGVLRVGDEVEILPGLIQKRQTPSKKKGESKWLYRPLTSVVKSIQSEQNNLQICIPGGLIGVQLTLDPGLTTKDGLVGNILRVIDPTQKKEPVKYEIMEVLRLITENVRVDENEYKITAGDRLVINHNARNVDCVVTKIRGNKVELLLDSPICTLLEEVVTISKKNGQNILIICRGKIMEGNNSELLNLE